MYFTGNCCLLTSQPLGKNPKNTNTSCPVVTSLNFPVNLKRVFFWFKNSPPNKYFISSPKGKKNQTAKYFKVVLLLYILFYIFF